MITVHSKDDDLTLMLRILKGDEHSFEKLFSRYYKPLVNFAFVYVKSEEEAEEVVADVFFNLWEARARLSVAHVRAYLYAMTKNEAIRRLKNRQPLFEDIEDILHASDVRDLTFPGRMLELEEFREHLQFAVSLLPPRCKQVFMLSRLDGLRYREISEILQISERTIEHHLAKAIHLIGDFLHRTDGRQSPITKA